MMYAGDEYYSDDVTSPLYRNTRNYTVYGAFASGERVMGSYEFRDQAIKAIERFMNRYPTTTFYVNNETVGWQK